MRGAWESWQGEKHFQSAVTAVHGPGYTCVRLHDLGGYGESNAFAAAVSVARLRHTIKRLEDPRKIARWHAGAFRSQSVLEANHRCQRERRERSRSVSSSACPAPRATIVSGSSGT